MKLRTLARFIANHTKDGPYIWTTDDNGQWVFQNREGRIIGLIDRGTHLDLHDIQNPEDKPGKPTARIAKGKKLKIIEGKLSPGKPPAKVEPPNEDAASLQRLVFGGGA